MSKLRLLELFGGIGACRKALMNLDIPFEVVDYVEYDKNPVEVYNALYNESYETQNILEWDKDIEVDMIVGGFPCQDISLAGKGAGIIAGETRSGLMYEMMRIIDKLKPSYVITENVKNLASDKFKPQLDEYINFLDNLGYKTEMKVTKGQYYGIPQARERLIMVSVKKEDKDFVFPEEKVKATNLVDYLDFREKDDLTFNFFNRYKEKKNPQATEKEFVDYINSLPTLSGIGSKRMGLYNFGEMDTITMPTNMTGTLTCRNVQNYNKKYWYNNKLYKPSPKMCLKLMGFSDSDYEKVKHLSDKQLYNASGNSIIVNVLQEIFNTLLVVHNEEN